MGTRDIGFYGVDYTATGFYTVTVTYDELHALSAGEPLVLVYGSSDSGFAREFVLTDPSTLFVQEALRDSADAILLHISQLIAEVHHEDSRTKLQTAQRHLTVAASDAVWKDRTRLRRDRGTDFFTAQREAAQALLEITPDSLTQDQQGQVNAIIIWSVNLAELLVRQRFVLKSEAIADATLWKDARSAFVQGEHTRAVGVNPGLALQLFETAWTHMQAATESGR